MRARRVGLAALYVVLTREPAQNDDGAADAHDALAMLAGDPEGDALAAERLAADVAYQLTSRGEA